MQKTRAMRTGLGTTRVFPPGQLSMASRPGRRLSAQNSDSSLAGPPVEATGARPRCAEPSGGGVEDMAMEILGAACGSLVERAVSEIIMACITSLNHPDALKTIESRCEIDESADLIQRWIALEVEIIRLLIECATVRSIVASLADTLASTLDTIKENVSAAFGPSEHRRDAPATLGLCHDFIGRAAVQACGRHVALLARLKAAADNLKEHALGVDISAREQLPSSICSQLVARLSDEIASDAFQSMALSSGDDSGIGEMDLDGRSTVLARLESLVGCTAGAVENIMDELGLRGAIDFLRVQRAIWHEPELPVAVLSVHALVVAACCRGQG
eukprot:m.86372 g.86372  ORF g.86372 m.86372 type:complete len:331 (-) comp8277_c0_seq2:239-1231(-)